MAKNKIQFQKGFSLTSFLAKYGTEEQCRDAFFKWRWPDGFQCPLCSGQHYCVLKARELYQCNLCHHQTSLIANTIMEATKLPFTTWFLGYLNQALITILRSNIFQYMGEPDMIFKKNFCGSFHKLIITHGLFHKISGQSK